MTLRLTPVVDRGKWMGRWLIAADDGAPLGEVYQAGGETRCVALVADIELAGPTLARTMTAAAAVLEHAAAYVVVDEPAPPWAPGPPVSRVIPAAEQAPIRVDEATSTPIGGTRAPTARLATPISR